MTDDDFAIGLHANIPRLRAMRILEMAESIAVALSENSDGREELMRAAGVPDRTVMRSRVDAWKAEIRAKAQR